VCGIRVLNVGSYCSLHISDAGLPDRPSSTIFVLVLESHLLRFIAPTPCVFFRVVY
jgi:hypothetical protein